MCVCERERETVSSEGLEDDGEVGDAFHFVIFRFQIDSLQLLSSDPCEVLLFTPFFSLSLDKNNGSQQNTTLTSENLHSVMTLLFPHFSYQHKYTRVPLHLSSL